MKKSYVYLLVVVVIVAAAAVWLLVAHKSPTANNYSNSTSSTTNTNTSNTNTSSGTPVATNAVTMQNFAFSPASITVKQGTTVVWTNKDSVAHTVTENDGQSGPNSGDVNPGSSYSFTFAKTGTYHYHCSIHAEMTGTVTVTN